MTKFYASLTLIIILLLTGCATYQSQYSNLNTFGIENSNKEIEKSFFLIGDAGNVYSTTQNSGLQSLKNFISDKETKDDYLIFLGDNIYEKGLPKKGTATYDDAISKIDTQIDVAKAFDGTSIFIPGNHDWYSGMSGLRRQEERIEKKLGKKSFQPQKGCPIDKIDITDNIVLLAIDTQWYLANWDDHPTINDNCEIKTRNEFIDELEDELKKNNEKTILLAMHHPAYTFGPHGGYFSSDKHLFPFQNKIPLPGLGSLIIQVRAQGGVSPQDRFNNRYDELMDRLVTLVRGNDRVILTSGHEHSLQYIDTDGIKQIVSGSGSKNSAVALGPDVKFTYGDQGFAVLDVYKDGSSSVNYYAAENGASNAIFSTQVYPKTVTYDTSVLPDSFEPTTSASAYDKQATLKGNSYKWFWGDHYRSIYGTDLEIPVATLDTLFGGFTIERKGGGHQTRSLRLIDKKGRNFALRGVKKSASRYIQTVIFTDTYIEKDFEETMTEDLLLDFYTASHPYATFVVGPLADVVDVYHTNPVLFYMPKHKALGKYNAEFGDELYILEERPDDGFLDVPSFGEPDAIESTNDLRKKLRKDEKYRVDEPAYIRARLFDMLLGDWDRHEDQWRWSRFDVSDDERIYRPIPRDRDQVFSNYDGALLDVLRALAPLTGQLQTYESKINDIKWLNVAGIKMDRTIIQNATKQEWLKQANFIQRELTDAIIDAAFRKLPKEVQNETSADIRKKLKTRRGWLENVASRYYDYLSRLVVVTGTDKDDLFEIIRENGKTTISVSRIKNGVKQPAFKERIINSNETKEVWIYGLDDDDEFVVTGNGSNPVFIRIIGGQNNDKYIIENGRAVKVHDHKSKPNTVLKKGGASIRFTDDYEVNNYDYEKLINRTNSIVPSIGTNPDDGLRIGITDIYTVRGFKVNPFHQKHIFRAAYYFGTQGFDFKYRGEFGKTIGKWNLLLSGHYTSENFTRNFFGFGNETENLEDDLDDDFYRVKTSILAGRLGVVRYGEYGGQLSISAGVENVEVEETIARFVSINFAGDPMVFDPKTFADVEVSYTYESFDNKASPARGMFFSFLTGVRSNMSNTERTYGYIHPELQFYNALSKDQKLVLKTMLQGQFNIGDSYEFYQAAVLGSGTGLRGYRTERFSGKSALAGGADLRYGFSRLKTGIVPIQLGIFGGFDAGRVWVEGEKSNEWHSDYGGGLWINAVDSLNGQLGFFNSDEGLRISFGLGVSL